MLWLEYHDLFVEFYSTYLQTCKIDNNGINANFVLLHVHFPWLFAPYDFSKCKIRGQLVWGLHFKGADLNGRINFEWQSQNGAGNIRILVLLSLGNSIAMSKNNFGLAVCRHCNWNPSFWFGLTTVFWTYCPHRGCCGIFWTLRTFAVSNRFLVMRFRAGFTKRCQLVPFISRFTHCNGNNISE